MIERSLQLRRKLKRLASNAHLLLPTLFILLFYLQLPPSSLQQLPSPSFPPSKPPQALRLSLSAHHHLQPSSSHSHPSKLPKLQTTMGCGASVEDSAAKQSEYQLFLYALREGKREGEGGEGQTRAARTSLPSCSLLSLHFFSMKRDLPSTVG